MLGYYVLPCIYFSSSSVIQPFVTVQSRHTEPRRVSHIPPKYFDPLTDRLVSYVSLFLYCFIIFCLSLSLCIPVIFLPLLTIFLFSLFINSILALFIILSSSLAVILRLLVPSFPLPVSSCSFIIFVPRPHPFLSVLSLYSFVFHFVSSIPYFFVPLYMPLYFFLSRFVLTVPLIECATRWSVTFYLPNNFQYSRLNH